MKTKSATRPAARHARSSKQTSRASHLSHHQRKCVICHHPERETIEEMFVHWHSAASIYRRFMLRDRSTIYDHAHATGLFAKRRRNMRYALEHIIERAGDCDISSNGIVAAIKACASLTTSGEWIEPARRIIFTSVSAPAPQREISHPFPDPLANKNGRRVYSHKLIDPSTTGDGWYTRNENNLPSSDSASQRTDPACSNASPASYSAPGAADYRNYQSASAHSGAPQLTTSATPSPSSTANASATNSRTANAPAPTTSAPVACSATIPQTANSNRYISGLKIPPTPTKQTAAPRSNRYK